ncbi:MAG: [LysW]-aminoadipate kinase [Ardenticatenaceae bacterium]|nr:[LysW]-aminoadipate kinase [Ardenticatenaceae bacterium]
MIIVKVGGGEGINYDAVCDDIAQLWQEGQRLIFVHGGSHRTNQVAEALGHPPQFVTSPSGYTSRLTDRATLEIFQMVYCGQINKTLVERLQRRGVNAVGLSGVDGRIWQGPRKKVIKVVEDGRTRILRNNFTGKVTEVNREFLQTLLDANCLPVLTPPAISFEGEAMNVDGDRAAAATAAAFQADELLILSNVPGVLRQFPRRKQPHLPNHRRRNRPRVGNVCRGRMRIKLLGAQEALTAGVRRVVLGDARGDQPILRALDGRGTVIAPAQPEEAA